MNERGPPPEIESAVRKCRQQKNKKNDMLKDFSLVGQFELMFERSLRIFSRQISLQSYNYLWCWTCIQQMNHVVVAETAGNAVCWIADDLLLAMAMALLEDRLRLVFQLGYLHSLSQMTRQYWTFHGTASGMVCCYMNRCWNRFCGRSQLVCGGLRCFFLQELSQLSLWCNGWSNAERYQRWTSFSSSFLPGTFHLPGNYSTISGQPRD